MCIRHIFFNTALVGKKRKTGFSCLSFIIRKRLPVRTASTFSFLVFRFTVPVAEITAGPERLLLCLWLRFLNDDLTAIEL